jgi:hypothetical protein
MLRNAAKANWTLEELGWSLQPMGSLADWDGLMKLFLRIIDSDRSVLEDAYLRRWQSAAVRAATSLNDAVAPGRGGEIDEARLPTAIDLG